METMSLPMKHTWRSRARSSLRSALAAAPASRAKAPSPPSSSLASSRSIRAATPGGGVVARAELVDVDARRAQARARGQVRRPASPPTATRRCGASRRGPSARLRQALPRPGQEALRIALDDVLQRAAVDLHRVGHVAAQPAGEDRRPHDEVVGQRHVGPRARADVAHGGDVGLHVGLDLGVAALQQRARLEALVAVGDVDRQQAADVRAPGRHAHRLAQRRDLNLARPASSHVPTASTKSSSSGRGSWQSRSTLCPARASAAHRRAL